jgi:hypothetical protein
MGCCWKEGSAKGVVMDWSDEFVAASNTHEVEALIAMFAPSCPYTDVPIPEDLGGTRRHP